MPSSELAKGKKEIGGGGGHSQGSIGYSPSHRHGWSGVRICACTSARAAMGHLSLSLCIFFSKINQSIFLLPPFATALWPERLSSHAQGTLGIVGKEVNVFPG